MLLLLLPIYFTTITYDMSNLHFQHYFSLLDWLVISEIYGFHICTCKCEYNIVFGIVVVVFALSSFFFYLCDLPFFLFRTMTAMMMMMMMLTMMADCIHRQRHGMSGRSKLAGSQENFSRFFFGFETQSNVVGIC